MLQVSIRLIDYEYAGLNPIAYDIANHWCEWACDYHTPTPHVMNYDLMPTPKQQRLFVRAYVEAILSLRRAHYDHNCPLGVLEEAGKRAEAEAAIVAAANAYLPASHLHWGIWGLLQVKVCPSSRSYNFVTALPVGRGVRRYRNNFKMLLAHASQVT